MLSKIIQLLGPEKEILTGVFVPWCGKITNYLIPFLLLIIFYRNLPENQSFLFSIIIAFISFYNIGGDFGLAEVSQKFLPILPAAKVISPLVLLNIVLNCFFSIILFFIQATTNYFGDYFWLLIFTVHVSIFNLLSLSFSGQLKLFTSGIYLILSNIGFVFITFLTYLFSNDPIFSLLLGRSLSWMVLSCVILFNFHQKKLLSLQLKPARRMIQFWSNVVILLFSDVLISLSNIILITYFSGSKEAASFNVINFFGSVPSLVGILVFTPALPILSYLFKNKPSKQISKLVLNIFFLTVVLILAVFSFSFFLGNSLIPTLTGVNLDSNRYLVFVLKLLADSIFTLGLPFLAYLLAREKTILVRNISIAKILIYLVLIAVSITNFQPTIPPLAALIVYLISSGAYLFYFLKDQDWAGSFEKLSLNEDGSLPMKEMLTKNKYKLIDPIDLFTEQKIEHFFILKLPPKGSGGNHYHKFSKRWILVLNSRAKIVLEDVENKKQQVFYIDSKKDNKIVFMDVYNAVQFENLSLDEELILFVLTNRKYNPKSPDAFNYTLKN